MCVSPRQLQAGSLKLGYSPGTHLGTIYIQHPQIVRHFFIPSPFVAVILSQLILCFWTPPFPSQKPGSVDVICERSLDSRDFFADEIPAGQPALGERAGGVKVQFLDVPVAIAVIVIPLARDLEAAEL